MKRLQVSMDNALHAELVRYARWDRRSVNNTINWMVQSFLKTCDQRFRDAPVDLEEYINGMKD